MRKWGAFLALSCSCLNLFAQAPVPNSLKENDTIKVRWGKVKIVDGASMTSSDDILVNISHSKEYTTLVTAIDDAGLEETFKSKGPITIFAPTNEAFNKLPAGELDSLLQPAHKLALSYILTYHAISGRLSAKDIFHKISSGKGKAVFTTLAGTTITATIDGNRNIVLTDDNGDQSIISKFDIPQSNGMLHVVTAVLNPKQKPI